MKHQVQFYIFLALAISSALAGGWWRDHYPPPNNEFGIALYATGVFFVVWTIVHGVKTYRADWVFVDEARKTAEREMAHAQHLRHVAERELSHQRELYPKR